MVVSCTKTCNFTHPPTLSEIRGGLLHNIWLFHAQYGGFTHAIRRFHTPSITEWKESITKSNTAFDWLSAIGTSWVCPLPPNTPKITSTATYRNYRHNGCRQHSRKCRKTHQRWLFLETGFYTIPITYWKCPLSVYGPLIPCSPWSHPVIQHLTHFRDSRV